MQSVELDYEWIDGLLDPKLEVKDSQRLRDLDKFGKARLKYLHKTNFDYWALSKKLCKNE